MDTKGKPYSTWGDKSPQEKADELYYMSDWFDLLGPNKKQIVERMPLAVRSTKKKVDGGKSVHTAIRISDRDKAWMDKICMEFRHGKARVFETESDFIRTAIAFWTMLCTKVMDAKDALENNEDIKFMEYVNFLLRSKNKINDALMVLEGYIKLLKNENISEEAFLKIVEDLGKKIPAFYRKDFNENLTVKLSNMMGSYGKRLLSGLKLVK
jgi:hypothetical protein